MMLIGESCQLTERKQSDWLKYWLCDAVPQAIVVYGSAEMFNSARIQVAFQAV